MSYGLKISKEGFGVGTAGNSDLTMSTDLNVFKIFATGVGTLSASTNGTVTHNLGYVPNFSVFMQDLDDSTRMNLVNASFNANQSEAFSGTSALVIRNLNVSTSRAYLYYVMYDPL